MPSQDGLEEALKASFPQLSAETLTEAETICEANRLTARELYYKWEAFAIARKRGTEPPTSAELRDLAASIQRSRPTQPKREARSVLHRPAAPAPKIDINDFFDYADADTLAGLAADEPAPTPGGGDSPQPSPMEGFPTPPVSDKKPHAKREPRVVGAGKDDGLIRSVALHADPSGITLPGDDAPQGPFASRENMGQVTASHNGGLKTTGKRPGAGPAHVNLLPRYGGDDFRFMNDDLPGRIESVRAHVARLADRVVARARASLPPGAELPPGGPSVFFTPSSDTVLAVGRVRVELDETDGAGVGRINANSVLLESVDGHVLKLELGRFRGLKKSCFLHAGMVVAVEGVNTNGRMFDVSAVHDCAIPLGEGVRNPAEKTPDAVMQEASAPGTQDSTQPSTQGSTKDEDAPMKDTDAPKPATKEEDTPAEEEDADAPILRVLVAAGPYTTSSNLRYAPLDALLDEVISRGPDVLILTGPFVDDAHPLVSEHLPVAFDQLFADRVLARIARLALGGGPVPQVVLVPALSDAFHAFVAPQPPFAAAGIGAHVTLAPNPAAVTVSLGGCEVTIGVTSLPSLQDIAADCVCWNRKDRFGAIAGHMVRQGSFYPTYPPSKNVPLDASHLARIALPAEEGKEGGAGVDVLVVPSLLKAFAKEVDGGVLAVNPGVLARGVGGGTFADLRLQMRRSGEKRVEVAAKSCAEITRI